MAGTPTTAPILLASNRGPVSYTVEDDGTLTPRRGGGGLVSGLSAIGKEQESIWVCAALSEGDRAAIRDFAPDRTAAHAALARRGPGAIRRTQRRSRDAHLLPLDANPPKRGRRINRPCQSAPSYVTAHSAGT